VSRKREASMDIDTFTEFAQRVVETEIPEALLKDLNLGILVLEEERRKDDGVILGEYSVSNVGRKVVLYYGSFASIYGGRSRKAWEEQIRRTIKHELQHHVEHLAGDRTLARQEEKQRRRRRQRE